MDPNPASQDPQPSTHHQRELAALQYCLAVLREREKADPEFAWLWSSKRKVAETCLRLLKFATGAATPPPGAPQPLDIPELTPEEQDLLGRTHPLLQKDRLPPAPLSPHEHAEWMEALRKKVQAFTESFAARDSSSGGSDSSRP